MLMETQKLLVCAMEIRAAMNMTREKDAAHLMAFVR
jgi:hypothetical protein